MFKQLFFTASVVLFIYNVVFTNNLLAHSEMQSVRPQRVTEKQEDTETTRTISNSGRPSDEETRIQRRIETQLSRITSELNLTEEQLEKAKNIFVEYEKKQSELRARINEMNVEKMEKFDELLTEDQKKNRNESNSNRENNRELRRQTRQEETQGIRRISPNANLETQSAD